MDNNRTFPQFIHSFRLEKLESEKKELENDLDGLAPEPVRFHPNVAELYVSKVNDLRKALNEDGAREEAAQILRGLVDEIRLHPIDDQLQIELIGDLATLLGFAEKKGADYKKPGSSGDPSSTKWLVAGAYNFTNFKAPEIVVVLVAPKVKAAQLARR